MDPNTPVRSVDDDQPVERVDPVPPARPVAYRRDVVQTDEISPAARVAQIVYGILAIIVALIIIRVILKALAANTAAGFTQFIYGVTDTLVAPFQGIFSTPASSRGSVFELSSIVAIIVYALIAWGVVRLIDMTGRRRTTTRRTAAQ